MKDKYLLDNMKIWSFSIILYSVLLLIIIGSMIAHKTSYIVIFALALIGFIVLIYIGYRFVYVKQKQMEKIFQLYSEGFLADDLFQQDIKIAPVFDEVFKILGERLDKSKRLNVSKKQAQYLALQNQINPHFLYNTLEGIRSEALCAGMDGVAEMTEALATFFRYTISNVDRLVTLEDELSNIETYYTIQQFRFGDKLSLQIEYDEEEDSFSVLDLHLPKLVLQPLVENAIYHGIEKKIGKGQLRIHIDRTEDRLIIKVMDDGLGMEKEVLDRLNNKLLINSLDDIDPAIEKKGGIAIVNVNSRIKLLFGEEYGIYLYSTPNLGTDVEITLPLIIENE